MEKTNACVKNNELAAVQNTHFEGKLNLARVKLIAHFVCALFKVRTVRFSKLANAFDHTASADSSLRRIQRFIAGYALDGDLVARLVFALLPQRETIVITIDLTNWKFGGGKWMAYLNENCIRYHMRIRNNFKVWHPSKNREINASPLFNGLKIGQNRHYRKIVSING